MYNVFVLWLYLKFVCIYIDGFYESFIVFKNLMMVYVLFFFLEKKYIRSCIKDYLINKNYYYKREKILGDLVDVIFKELNYVLGDKEIFFVIGCKCILEKVDYVMDGF